jgi:translation initiation factor 2-alpha kinase 4
LKLEQLDQDPGYPSDAAGLSADGTGQVGTYFYTAPEIEQGWPKIDEKVNFWLLLLFCFIVVLQLCYHITRFLKIISCKLLGHLGLQADMYSLGVVFFELWHPFGTAMERHIVLTDLKQKGELPPAWVAEFPEQASLLRRLMSPSPSDRPSATELLQNAFPPRMESELLDGK